VAFRTAEAWEKAAGEGMPISSKSSIVPTNKQKAIKDIPAVSRKRFRTMVVRFLGKVEYCESYAGSENILSWPIVSCRFVSLRFEVARKTLI
jgi:hypothetical protein